MRGANQAAFGADQNIRGVQTFRNPQTGALANTKEISTMLFKDFVYPFELTSFLTIGAAQGKTLVLFGNTIDVHALLPWVISFALLLGGGIWFRVEARAFRLTWERLMAEVAPARVLA